jgi:hypothetical protein
MGGKRRHESNYILMACEVGLYTKYLTDKHTVYIETQFTLECSVYQITPKCHRCFVD